MKKKLLVCLAMIVCILGLTACGSGSAQTANSFISAEQAKNTAESIAESLPQQYEMLSTYGISMKEMISMQGMDPADYALDIAAMDSYASAAEEFGNFVAVLPEETEVNITDDKADVKVKIQGDKIYKDNKQRTATIEVVFVEEGSGIDSITVSTDYDMSELMVKAALNTVLGMGTVFAVLILISLIIYCFNFIPKIQAAFRKKTPAGAKEAAMDNVVTQIAAQEEESAEDDLELVAVIAAAIAASEGASSADGYVVRSIIRR